MQFPKMEICKRYDLNCVKVLEKEYENLNEYQLVLMLKITDPFSNAVSHMSKKVIASIFGRIKVSSLIYQDQMKIALFYLPIILQQNTSFPLNIVTFAFDMIHSGLANQTLPNKEWIKIENKSPFRRSNNIALFLRPEYNPTFDT